MKHLKNNCNPYHLFFSTDKDGHHCLQCGNCMAIETQPLPEPETPKPYCIYTNRKQEKKPGTKTVWQTTKEETRLITELEYNNIVNAAPYFRRLGGSESLTRQYTYDGYKVTNIISTRPDKEARTIHIFNFEKRY